MSTLKGDLILVFINIGAKISLCFEISKIKYYVSLKYHDMQYNVMFISKSYIS